MIRYIDQTSEGSTSRVKLVIWENSAGLENLRKIMIRSYVRGTHGIFLMYDITDRNSFKNIPGWFAEIKKYETDQPPAMILVGSKCDLRAKRVVTVQEAEEMASNLGIPCIESSAVEIEKVDEAILEILNMIGKVPVVTDPPRVNTPAPSSAAQWWNWITGSVYKLFWNSQ